MWGDYMATVIFPDHKLIEKEGIAKGWKRQQMYDHYCAELRRMNPSHFNADGPQKNTLAMVKRIIHITDRYTGYDSWAVTA